MIVQSTVKFYNAASATTATQSIDSTGDPLFVCIPESRAVTITATYNGVAGTLISSITNGNARAYAYWWSAPATGANNLVVTYSGAITQRVFGAIQIYGVDPNGSLGTPVTATGSSQNKTFNITTTKPNSIIIDCFADLGNSHTAASGQTIIGTEFPTDALNRLFSYRVVAAAGATSNTWNGNVGAADYAGLIFEVKGSDYRANRYYHQQQAAI